MNATFNLIEQPWIRVITKTGAAEDVSIEQAFANASQIERLAGESKTQDFAVLRVLLAILYDAFRDDIGDEESMDWWKEIWEAKQFPAEVLNEYLAQWKDYFDLIDEKKPFMQVPDLRTSKGEWKDLSIIIPDSPGAGSLFNQRDPQLPLDFATAARWLIYTMAYDVSGIKPGCVGDDSAKGGKSYPKGIGWAGWLGGTTILGASLFETLMLNFVADLEIADEDRPIWHGFPMHVGEMNVRPGPLSLLTWPQRRIRLRAEAGKIVGALLTNGNDIAYQRQRGNELMTGFRYSDPQSRSLKDDIYMPAKLTLGRSLWRGLEALVSPIDGQEKTKGRSKQLVPAFTRASSLDWISRLTYLRVLPRDFPVKIQVVSIEYGTQNSVIAFEVVDSLTVNSAILLSESIQLRQLAVNAISTAENSALALKNLASNLVRAEGGESTNELRDRVQGQYFSRLDPEFQLWLSQLTPDSDLEESGLRWREIARQTLDTYHDELIQEANSVAFVGRTIDDRLYDLGHAERMFRIDRNKALGLSHKSEKEKVNAAH